jgi:hypothetical protein
MPCPNCLNGSSQTIGQWIQWFLGLCALSSNVFHVCVKSYPSGGFLGEGTVRHGGRCSSTGHNPTPTPLPAAVHARTDFGLSLILDILANFEQFTRLQAINQGCYTHRIVDHCCVCESSRRRSAEHNSIQVKSSRSNLQGHCRKHHFSVARVIIVIPEPEDMPSLRGVKLISPMQSANTILAGDPWPG